VFDEIAAAGLAFFFEAPWASPFHCLSFDPCRRTHASLDIAGSATTTGSRAAAEVYDPLGAALDSSLNACRRVHWMIIAESAAGRSLLGAVYCGTGSKLR
jgi:hypothetical protein